MTNDEGVLINDEARMTNDETMTKSENSKHQYADESFWTMGMLNQWSAKSRRRTACYDLEERTARFGEAIIDFAKTDSTECGHESSD